MTEEETVNARDNSLSEIDEVAIYVLGRIEQFIEDFAKSSGTSAYELTERVATLLSAQIGEADVDHVPEVQPSASRKRITVEPMEVDGGAYQRRPRKISRRRKHQQYRRFEGEGEDRFTVARKLWDKGMTIKQIAKKMNIGPHTAGTYVSKAMRDDAAEVAKRKYWREKKAKQRHESGAMKAVGKGGTYNGKHWMQNPANREKVMQQIKHMHEVKNEVARQRVN
jgi:DNA-binding transcriptional MerR regulator